MVVAWMCVRSVVVMMVVRCGRCDICERYWVWSKSKHIERGWSVIKRLVVVVMMVMVWVYVMVVMCRVTRFSFLRSTLSIWCISTCAVGPFFISGTSTILSTSSTAKLRTCSSFFNLIHSCTNKIATFDMTWWSYARWCCCAIHRLSCSWCGSSNSTTKPREHATKLALDARIVTTWCYMSGLCALHSLWEW